MTTNDITWVSVLALFQATNTVLWTTSYPDVRALHSKEEVQDLLMCSLDAMEKCRVRWPGTESAANLYLTLSRACLKSYDVVLSTTPPSSFPDTDSPCISDQSSAATSSRSYAQQQASHEPPNFSSVFGQKPEPIQTSFAFDPLSFRQPSFRSGSIFVSPSALQLERRASYFPPDFVQPKSQWTPQNTDEQMQLPAYEPHLIKQENGETAPTYGLDASPYGMQEELFFGSTDLHLRQGSLSQEQQLELMHSFEMDGVSGIDSFINTSSRGV